MNTKPADFIRKRFRFNVLFLSANDHGIATTTYRICSNLCCYYFVHSFLWIFFSSFFLFVLTQFLLNNKHIFVIFGNLLGFSALTHLIPTRPQFIFLLLSSILIEYSTHTHTQDIPIFPGIFHPVMHMITFTIFSYYDLVNSDNILVVFITIYQILMLIIMGTVNEDNERVSYGNELTRL